MKNTFKIFLGCAVLVSALTAGTVRSQGTAGASQLLIPVGTETVALSGTNVGTVAGIDALFTNVAGLARRNSGLQGTCLLYTSPSPRDGLLSRMPSSA